MRVPRLLQKIRLGMSTVFLRDGDAHNAPRDQSGSHAVLRRKHLFYVRTSKSHLFLVANSLLSVFLVMNVAQMVVTIV